MDPLFTRLEVASHAGNVNLLKELLMEDKLLLEKVTGGTSGRDNNPLHIAAMLGHADFVREVINRKPALAKELNSQGLSALHLAAAYGHFNVVKELLKLQNGGKTAAELLFEPQPDIRVSVSSDSSNPLSIPRTPLQQPHCLNTKNHVEEATLELQEKKKEKNHDPKILLLVATLVATVTFQAALNPPGGVEPDDKDHEYTKGQPVLAGSLDYFQVFNMLALFSSVSVMMLLLCAVPRKKKIVMRFLVWVIWGAAFSMGLAFTMGISALYNYDVYYNYNYNNDNSTNHNTTNTIDYQINEADHTWYSAQYLLYGWFFLLRLGISWVVVQFLIFLVKKTGLWEPVAQRFAFLNRGCFLNKWQQFTNTKCCQLFKNIICFVLILCALGSIGFLWVSYMYTHI